METPFQITPSDLRKIVAADSRLSAIAALVRSERPFRMPKTHIPWADLANIAAVVSMEHQHKDAASRLHDVLWVEFMLTSAPVYCLSNELLRAFEATDFDGLGRLVPPDWGPPLPLFLLALPHAAVCAPDGAHINYLMVMIHHPDLTLPIAAEHPTQITISCLDGHGNIWFNGSGIGPDGITTSERMMGANPTDDADRAFLSRMVGVALQSVLAMSYLPELIDEPAAAAAKPGKIRERPKAKPAELAPRWIGKTFVRPRANIARSGSGSSSPKSAHWRRGHWRQQPIGKGRQLVRLVWIRPMFVGVEN
jgi:hypothetical protein